MDDVEAKAQELMRAYAVTFGSPAGQVVLADLELFCHALEPCAVPGNHDRTLMNEGNREVFLRIQKFSRITMKDLYDLRLGRPSLRDDTGERLNG